MLYYGWAVRTSRALGKVQLGNFEIVFPNFPPDSPDSYRDVVYVVTLAQRENDRNSLSLDLHHSALFAPHFAYFAVILHESDEV